MSVPNPTSARFVNLEGQRFGRLLVVEYAGKSGGDTTPGKYVESTWLCACKCGGSIILRLGSIRRGAESCGQCQYGGFIPPKDALPIPSAPGYMVADGGIVYSCHSSSGKMNAKWHVVKSHVSNEYGHRIVPIVVGGKKRSPYVHQLVLEAFKGPCPEGLESCHNDGDPQNNYIYNLRYDTHANNNFDRKKHGTEIKGEQHGCAKLTEVEIPLIFQLFNDGRTKKEIAAILGVSSPLISFVINGKNWKHVTDSLPKVARRGNWKLTDEEVRNVFLMSCEGLTQEEIAENFGVSLYTIGRILRRETYDHVPVPIKFLVASGR